MSFVFLILGSHPSKRAESAKSDVLAEVVERNDQVFRGFGVAIAHLPDLLKPLVAVTDTLHRPAGFTLCVIVLSAYSVLSSLQTPAEPFLARESRGGLNSLCALSARLEAFAHPVDDY